MRCNIVTLTKTAAIGDVRIVRELRTSIRRNGVVKNKGEEYNCYTGEMQPCVHPANEHEIERLRGLERLMEKYNYGWYFTANLEETRQTTMEEQLAALAKFEAYILSRIGEGVRVPA
jgi:hypothetical protein